MTINTARTIKVMGQIVRGFGKYAVNGKNAGFIADFTGDEYRLDRLPVSFADLFTFARTGPATQVDANGDLETVADGVARTGHHIWNGSEWAGPFLQLESEARTNLVTYSEDFTDASWTKTAVALSSESIVNPAGGATSTKMTPDTNTTSKFAFVSQALSAITYSQSVFFKADGYNFASIAAFGDGVLKSVVFNISTGVVVSQSNAVGQVEDFGGGWYRCSIYFTPTAASHTIQFNPLATSSTAAFAGDGTSGVLIYGAQLEAAATPSSYIPTAGTTATRNAETLTIAAANLPYPEPVVVGPELVTNGTFDADSDWTKGTGWTISGGVASFTTSGSGANLGQVISTEVGKVYEISCDLLSTNSALNYFYVSAVLPSQVSPELGLTLGRKSFVFVASSTTTTLGLRGSSLSTATFDNISVKEINPLAVSIAMEGTMTYADTGSAQEVEHFSWRQSISDRIKSEMSTAGSFTGRMAWIQTESGTGDVVVESGNGSYSPGINVPFNISSRHGSTFINGAVDGTALTADLTPTALPDLSATDVDIGPIFMGSIGRIVIWADDIADAGIAAASA